MAMSRKTIHYQLFYDHAGCIALSATYPVPGSVVLGLCDEQRRQPGTVESQMSYPCVSVYVPASGSVLNTKRKQEEMKRWVRQIVMGLRSAAFFKAFRGIRFEIFDGRPALGGTLGSERPDRRCLMAVGEHYREEREKRHLLQIVRANLVMHEQIGAEFRRVQSHGDESYGQKVRLQYQQSLEQVCSSAGLLCSEVAKFNTWRRNLRVKISQPPRRRKTLSDLDPNQNPPSYGRQRRYSIPLAESQYRRRCQPKRSRRASVCGHYETDCRANLQTAHNQNTNCTDPISVQEYIRRRLERLIKDVKSRFHATIEPPTFAVPSSQPWSSLVVILPHTYMQTSVVEVLLFDRELSLEEMMDGCVQFDMDLELRLVAASIDSSKQRMTINGQARAIPSLAKVMGQFLYGLGYCGNEGWKLIA